MPAPRHTRLSPTLALAALVWSASAAPAAIPHAGPNASAPGGALFIFIQRGDADADRRFGRDHLPALQELATALGLASRIIDARAAAPVEVTGTPLLVYLNGPAPIVYRGRLDQPERIRSFLRAARRASLPAPTRTLADGWARQVGRATFATTAVVAPLAGSPPADHDATAFESEWRAALDAALPDWTRAPARTLGPADQQFAIEIHPWRSAAGELRLTVALYAACDAQQPLFTTGDKPITAAWDARAAALAQAATALARALTDAAAPTAPTAFQPLPANTANCTWESLLSDAIPAEAPATAPSGGPPAAWRVRGPLTGQKHPVRFHFMPPLQPYAGEVAEIQGEFRVAPDGTLAGASAQFIARMSTLSMHDPELDDALAGEVFLNTRRFPTATFTLSRLECDLPRLAYGQFASGRMLGQIDLKGVRLPLSVRVTLEPTVSADGRPQLELRGAFSLNIAPFDLEGPVGPAPSGETMLFYPNVLLEPAD